SPCSTTTPITTTPFSIASVQKPRHYVRTRLSPAKGQRCEFENMLDYARAAFIDRANVRGRADPTYDARDCDARTVVKAAGMWNSRKLAPSKPSATCRPCWSLIRSEERRVGK